MPSGQQEMRSREAWPRQMNGRQADVSQVGGTRLLSRKRKADVSGGEVAMEVLPELSRKVFVATVCPLQPRQHVRDNSPTPPNRHATDCKQKSHKQVAFHATLSPQPNHHAPPKTDMVPVHLAVDSRLPKAGLQAWQYRGPEHCRKQSSLSKVQSSWSDTLVGVQRAPQTAVTGLEGERPLTRPPGEDFLKTEEQVRGYGACEEYHPQVSRSQHRRGGYQSSVDGLLAYGPAILLTQNNNSLPAGRHVTSRGQGRRQRNCREVQTNMNFSQQLDGEYVFEYNYRRRQVFLPQLSPSHTPNRLKNYAEERFCDEYDPKQNSVSVSNHSHHVMDKCLDYECLRRRGEALHNDIVRSLNLLNKTWATGGSREGENVATTSGNDGAKGQGAVQQTVMPQPEVVTVSQPSKVYLRIDKDDGKRPDDNLSCKYSAHHRSAAQTPTSTPDVSQMRALREGGSVRHATCEEKITRSCTANKECLATRQGQTDGSQPTKGRQQEVTAHPRNVSSQSLHDALLIRRMIAGHTTATVHNGFRNQTPFANQARVQSGEMRTQLRGDSKAAPGTLCSKEGAVATKATNLSSPFSSNVTKYPTSQSMSLAFHGSGGNKSLSASKLPAFCNSNLSKSSIRGSSATCDSLAAFPLHRNRSPQSRGSSITSLYTANKSSFPCIAATSSSATVSRPGPTNPSRFLDASSIKACGSSELNRKQSSSPSLMISHLTNVKKTSTSAVSANQLTASPRTPITAPSIDSGTKHPPDSTRKEPSLPAKTALSSASTVDGPFRFSYCSENSVRCVDSSTVNAAHDPTSSVTLTRTASKDCTSPRTAARTALHSTSPRPPARSVVSGPVSPESLPRTVSRDLTSPGKHRSTTSRGSTSSNIAMSVVSDPRSTKISQNTILLDPMSPRTPSKTVKALPQNPRDVLSDPGSPPVHMTTSRASNTAQLVTSCDWPTTPGGSWTSEEHVKSCGGERCDLSTVNCQDAVRSDSSESALPETSTGSNKPTTFSSSLLEPVTSDLSTSRHSDPLFPATLRAQDQCVGVMPNQDQGRSRTGLSPDSSNWGSTTGGSREMVVRQPDQDGCDGSAEYARGVRAQADKTSQSAGHKWAPCPGTWGTWGTLRRLLVLALPLAFLFISLTSRPCAITGEPFLRLERVLDDVLAHLSLHHVAPPAL